MNDMCHINGYFQNPLLHIQPTINGISNRFSKEPRGSVYLGCGLTTMKAPTVAVPFDILMFLLSAEDLRRRFHLDQTHCLIADTHALSNPFCDKSHINLMSQEYQRILNNFSQVSGIQFSIHPASSFDSTDEYQELLTNIDPSKGEYLRRELADILWFYRQHNVRLKLGWLIHANEKKAGRDERYFDSEFIANCTDDMSFAYTRSGRTFDNSRPYVSPYVSIASENRLRIHADNDVEHQFKKFQCSQKKLKQLSNTVDLWNALAKEKIDTNQSLPMQIQNIINLLV